MKKAWLILILAFFAGSKIQAQSSYISAGTGYLPNHENLPLTCYSFWSPYDGCQEVKWKHGYLFYAEVGKEVQLFEHWSLLGAWQVRQQVNPVIEKFWNYENNLARDLHWESTSDTRYQFTTFGVSLSLDREIEIGNHNLDIFAGGYALFQLQNWSKFEGNGISYFTDVVEENIFDSTCQCYQTVIISKTKLDPPSPHEFKGENEVKNDRHVNFGIHGDVTFPILTSKEGALKGRVSISHDFRPFYQNVFTNDLRQTSFTAGLVFEPVKVRQPHVRKPEKRTLSSGIYSGVSLHTVFVSVDGFWLSSKKLGIDVAGRYGLIRLGRFPSAEIYAGSIYHIGNSRFFVKMGGAYTWILDDEYLDESKSSLVLGGKYVWPFSKFLGLQVNAGWLMSKGEKPWPELGVGVLFLPN